MKDRHRIDPLSDHRGFTLLETLIALTILAIGLLGLLGLQIAAIKGNASGFQVSTAVALGESRIEELKSLSTTSAQLSAGIHADGNVTVQGIAYTRSYQVQDDTPISGVSTLILTLTWADSNTGTTRTTQVSTRILKG